MDKKPLKPQQASNPAASRFSLISMESQEFQSEHSETVTRMATSDSPYSQLRLMDKLLEQSSPEEQDQGVFDSMPDSGWNRFSDNADVNSAEDELGIHDKHPRTKVHDTTRTPNRWICDVETTFRVDGKRQVANGTGVLISPRHVLTAAHVLWNERGNTDIESVRVYPGRHGYRTKPFGFALGKSNGWVRHPKWRVKGKSNVQYDYGLITLDTAIGNKKFKSLEHKPLGHWGQPSKPRKSFMFRFHPASLDGHKILTAGYPGDKGSGNKQYFAKGMLSSVNLRGRARIMTVDSDARHGQSGSPVWIEHNGKHYMTGILVTIGESGNTVVRLTKEMIRQLRLWMSPQSSDELQFESHVLEDVHSHDVLDDQAPPKSPTHDHLALADWPLEELHEEFANDVSTNGHQDVIENETETQEELYPLLDEEVENAEPSNAWIQSETSTQHGIEFHNHDDDDELEHEHDDAIGDSEFEHAWDTDLDREEPYESDRESPVENQLSDMARSNPSYENKSIALVDVQDYADDDTPLAEEQATASTSGRSKDIKLELELNYGMEKLVGGEPRGLPFIPDNDPDLMPLDSPVTTHTNASDGFSVVMDGPRIEIETQRFALDSSAEFRRITGNVVAFMQKLERRARATRSRTVTTTPLKHTPGGTRLGFSAGRPKDFHLPEFSDTRFVAFPTKSSRKQNTWFRRSTSIGVAPQITIDIPLGSVQALVAEIRASQRGRRPVRLTGSSRSRAGLRSDALFFAHDSVIKSFQKQVKAGRAVSTELTKPLAGFMILLVQYLRTSEIRYHKPDRPNDPSFDTPDRNSRDFEAFAKAYVPIVVHTHFSDLFDKALLASERAVFMRLYGDLGVRQRFYDLALNRPGTKTGTAELFPARTRALHRHNLGRVLTWEELLVSTIDPAVTLKNADGNQVLPTPLASASKGTAKAGTPTARVRGVRLELRRAGYKWWRPRQWLQLASFSFDMARKLNGFV